MYIRKSYMHTTILLETSETICVLRSEHVYMIIYFAMFCRTYMVSEVCNTKVVSIDPDPIFVIYKVYIIISSIKAPLSKGEARLVVLPERGKVTLKRRSALWLVSYYCSAYTI